MFYTLFQDSGNVKLFFFNNSLYLKTIYVIINDSDAKSSLDM